MYPELHQYFASARTEALRLEAARERQARAAQLPREAARPLRLVLSALHLRPA